MSRDWQDHGRRYDGAKLAAADLVLAGMVVLLF